MKRVYIDHDERWPDFYIEDRDIEGSVTITDEEYEWIQKASEEYNKVQWFLEEKSGYDN